MSHAGLVCQEWVEDHAYECQNFGSKNTEALRHVFLSLGDLFLSLQVCSPPSTMWSRAVATFGCGASRAFSSGSQHGGVCAKLASRRVIQVSGPDASKFLQGLVTNDVTLLHPNREPLQYTYFLNHKGRAICDSFIWCQEEHDADGLSYVLDCRDDATKLLLRVLKMYRLKSKVDIVDKSEEATVWSIFPEQVRTAFPSDLLLEEAYHQNFHADPRSTFLGYRKVLFNNDVFQPTTLEGTPFKKVEESQYDRNRRFQGVLEGLEMSGQIPLECNLDSLNGVNFNKGCYVGQELTARTHFKGLVRKRCYPVYFASFESDSKIGRRRTAEEVIVGPPSDRVPFVAPAGSSTVSLREKISGTKAGKLILFNGNGGTTGMALLRVDQVMDEKCRFVGSDSDGKEVEVCPFVPSWVKPNALAQQAAKESRLL